MGLGGTGGAGHGKPVVGQVRGDPPFPAQEAVGVDLRVVGVGLAPTVRARAHHQVPVVRVQPVDVELQAAADAPLCADEGGHRRPQVSCLEEVQWGGRSLSDR